MSGVCCSVAPVNRVVIAGLGLIGGSLGMALRRRGWSVAYVDPFVSLEDARAANAAEERLDNVSGDFVVLATPVDAAMRIARTSDAALLTTTCSVLKPFRDPRVVAGHPLAGSEKSGLAAARHDLFEGKTWFVDRDDRRVREMIGATGARQVIVDPDEHDDAAALTSHLPQAISTALASLIERKRIDPMFIGTGLRTLLRLAGSSHTVWGPVLEENRDAIERARDELISILENLDGEDFERAQRLMRAMSSEPPAR